LDGVLPEALNLSDGGDESRLRRVHRVAVVIEQHCLLGAVVLAGDVDPGQRLAGVIAVGLQRVVEAAAACQRDGGVVQRRGAAVVPGVGAAPWLRAGCGATLWGDVAGSGVPSSAWSVSRARVGLGVAWLVEVVGDALLLVVGGALDVVSGLLPVGSSDPEPHAVAVASRGRVHARKSSWRDRDRACAGWATVAS